MPAVAIAIGSNLGDRRAHLTWAVEQLAPHLADLRLSSVLETEPFDVPSPQPPYLNAVIVGDTRLTVDDLLRLLLELERTRGRRRPSLRAPRTLDLDLIFYDGLLIDTPELTVPHPRFRERRFVLAPLAEIAPGWKDPVSGKRVEELLDELEQGGE
jgi:2-amino-4-hydroxy-6-hydroxymethyldihydropteridine diphosphokinase